MNNDQEKIWTPEEIREKLQTRQKWVERALVAIHKRQTSAERISLSTKSKNGIGFNAFDAAMGSSFAEWVRSGKRLSDRQLQCARRIVVKYVGQLAAIANGKV